MDNSALTIRIENLRFWKSNNWVKYSTKNMCDSFLRLHFDQLLITTENKVLESINLSSKIKGVFKQDCIILIVLTVGGETRKIKFQIKDNFEQNLKELAKKFPLLAYNNISSNCNTSANVKFQSTEEVLKGLLDKEVSLPLLPASPDLDHLLKLCILDPLFPQTVMKIQSAIEKKMTQ
ncbi:uncharacterized protein LOC121736215 [Aricia agestis]|uniref:uncharacterized protein LOC121736215 n=1 Tax=Aricia agestis TaxID=91739 RepID=UPI001C202E6A|nr:uncharacterized protein LOC121736215 [Aricia agestis]